MRIATFMITCRIGTSFSRYDKMTDGLSLSEEDAVFRLNAADWFFGGYRSRRAQDSTRHFELSPGRDAEAHRWPLERVRLFPVLNQRPVSCYQYVIVRIDWPADAREDR
jgi:hypothetical protein